jgi:probable HAF family extracellular repeat protein
MNMKLRSSSFLSTFVFALLLLAAGMMLRLHADAQVPESHERHSRESVYEDIVYEVVRLPSLGDNSRASALNPRGQVAGVSDIPGTNVRHATLWIDGEIIDLGTLDGGDGLSSSVAWPGINARGTISGISQIEELDPLGQAWSCGHGGFLPNTGHRCLGFAWKEGEMKSMPTLGGYNSFAAGLNNRDQVVGWAETDQLGEFCDPASSQLLTFQGVVWDPREDSIEALPPYPGDEASAAVDINDRGQVVGISGDCDQAVGRFSARRAVMWDQGNVIDLGNLGGTSWHTPVSINALGHVAGFSNLPDDGSGSFNAQAFIWNQHKGMQPLGTLEGDLFSQANSINERNEVVGGSCCSEPFNWRAVIWRGDELVDLNFHIHGDFEGHLYFARDIDNHGVITGDARDLVTGEFFGFVATPKRR